MLGRAVLRENKERRRTIQLPCISLVDVQANKFVS
jgi:hypothetical protein